MPNQYRDGTYKAEGDTIVTVPVSPDLHRKLRIVAVARMREYAAALGISAGPHVEAHLDEAADLIQSLSDRIDVQQKALERLVAAVPVVAAWGEHPISDCDCPFCNARALTKEAGIHGEGRDG